MDLTADKPSHTPGKPAGWKVLIAQFAALLLVTVVFTTFDWDRKIAALFHREGQGWYLAKQPLWVWLHAYGTIPGIAMTVAALVTWMAGLYAKRLKPWRRPCLVVVLTTILAAGLLVNAVLKQYWGRPRPDQTVEFGGKWEYRPIYPPGTPGKGASFPCGHCTMGFVFLAMAVFRRRSAVLAYGGVAAGIVLGALLSAARVVQGAHFVSDTIWSLGIVGMVATALIYYLPGAAARSRSRPSVPLSPGRKILLTFVALTAIVIVAAGFMTRRPYYNTMVHPLNLSTPIEAIHIKINGEPERLSIDYADGTRGQLKVDAHGFGWMEFDYQMGFGARVEAGTVTITLHIEARSYFAELDHALTLTLPRGLKNRIKVMLNDQPMPGSLGPMGRSDDGMPSSRAKYSMVDRPL